MSRIGRAPIEVPQDVTVEIQGNQITVKGKKGTLQKEFHKDMKVTFKDQVITVERPSENKMHKSLHGLTRSLINNMVVGVTEGFQKELQINGVGYRAQKQGKELVMSLGYSHPVKMEEEDGISIEVPSQTQIIISGPDKQKVGQFAAQVREKRPPEPYKGKGIRYADEYVQRKEGKAGKGAKS